MSTNRFAPPVAPVEDFKPEVQNTAPVDPSNAVQLEFELKYLDLLLFNAAHQLLSPLVQAFVLLLGVFIFFQERAGHDVVSAAVTAAFWCCLIWSAQLAFTAVYLISRRNKTLFTRHIIGVREDAFLQQTRYGTSTTYWPGVAKAVSRPGFVGVYTSQNAAHIIPNRAFRSDSQRKEFLSYVDERIRRALPAR